MKATQRRNPRGQKQDAPKAKAEPTKRKQWADMTPEERARALAAIRPPGVRK